MTLREILDEYIAFQEQIITRRTIYDRRKAQERAHLLEGLLIAEDNIDAVIQTIRESYDDAKENLMNRFGLSDVQAQAILDMQLKRLQGLEKEKLQNEYKELEARIAYFNELLSSEEKIRGVLKDELTAIRDRYGDDRVTEIQDVEDEIDIEDLIEEEECVFTLTAGGYIKRTAASTYKAQRRGGKGITAMSTKRRTMWTPCSPPPPTISFSFSPTRAGSTARRAIRSPRRAAPPGAPTWSMCCPSSRMKRSPP